MDWNDLRYVLAIERKGSLVGAAAALGVAHTTAGRRLKALEEKLGVRLFDRTPDGLIATNAGADLAAVALRVEEEVLLAQGRVVGTDAALRGALRVSTLDVLFLKFEGVFTSFIERYPHVELTLVASNERASLTRREADVVLRLTSAPPEHLIGRKVGPVQFGLYASHALVERVGEDAPLSAYPWIGWDERVPAKWFESWLEQNALGAQIVMRLDNSAMLMAHALRAGLGVQILPCFVGDTDAELCRVAPLEEMFRLDLWVLTLRELRGKRRVQAFMEHVSERLRERRDVLAGHASLG